MKLQYTDIFDLSGFYAAVIGGTGVLGAQFCRALARFGARVAVLGRSEERGSKIVDELIAEGHQANFVPVDVTSRTSVEHAALAVSRSGSLDILVNSAGVNSSTPFERISDNEWYSLHDVNLRSVFLACQIFATLLSKSENGASIVNISSASAGPPLSKVLGYGVAKAGVNNLTQYLANDLSKDQIRVNALVPGFFPAEQNRKLLSDARVTSILEHTPMKRLGTPSDLDGALIFLCSPKASSFVTGSLIHVDGGFSAMSI